MQSKLHKLESSKSYDAGQFFFIILLKRNTISESQPFPKDKLEEFALIQSPYLVRLLRSVSVVRGRELFRC